MNETEHTMTNITAAMVKDLRDKTGAGMMDCKNALSETAGDMEAAIDWLRKKGLSKAAKKAGRIAAEGLVGVSVGDGAAALVEVNSETDFVARNDEFKAFVKSAAGLALEAGGDAQKLLAAPLGGSTVEDTLKELVGRIGENMSVRRATALTVNPGVVASYVHSAAGPELGKIGVLVALKSEGDHGKLNALGKQIAMHIAAAAPMALTQAHVAPEVLARELNIQKDKARQSGKPENIVEKIAESAMKKFYEENVLLNQIFVVDGETPIAKVVEKAAKEIGKPVELVGFVRFAVGEGIEKVDSDFADEVAKMTGPKD